MEGIINKRAEARIQAQKKAGRLLDRMSLEEQALLLRYDSPAILRLDIPAYNWWCEALHGVARAGTATVFPVPIAMAATFDKDLVRRIGDRISTEARAKYNEFQRERDHGIYKGLTFWSPNINLYRDPRWGRGHETFGEDPFLTGRMGRAFIEGLQGDDERFLKSAACVKHFAVHSGPEALRHELDVRVNEKELWEYYLPAFEYCVVSGQVEGVMGGYSSLNGRPLCGNDRLIRGILREKWGFQGYYVSDCWAIRDFHENHRVTHTAEESAAMALNAGCDVNCGSCYQTIVGACYHGLISRETIRISAERALTTRILLGEGEETPWDRLDYRDVDTAEAEQLNEEAAVRSVVLLKNDGILPIQLQNVKTIGLIGPNADSVQALMGNYHGTASHYVTVMEGLRQALERRSAETGQASPRLLYASGSEVMDRKAERLAEDHDRVSEACAVARRSDLVILCLGLDARYEGEAHHISTGESQGGDREDVRFPLCQRVLLDAVLRCEKPVVLCCMSGGMMDLEPYADRVNGILQAWYPGARGGHALARILLGEDSPSGKLPVTFYGSDYHIPEFTDYSLENRTYRYAKQGIFYPFGYGLTYGKTEMVWAGYDRAGHSVEFRIRNLSSRKLREVVQVYRKNSGSRLDAVNPVLCGFAGVELRPFEEREGRIELDAYTFTVVDENGCRVADGEEYELYVGTHGPDERSTYLTETPVIRLPVKVRR